MIIFLNGTINSGKSTVAKLLQKKLGKAAVIEIDDLRNMVEWMPLDESIPLNLKNALDVIKNFASEGIDTIVPYPLSKKNYDYFISNLTKEEGRVFCFTLDPGKKKALSNRGARELDEWERSRIEHHYAIGLPRPEFGEILDTSNQVEEETAELIVSKLK